MVDTNNLLILFDQSHTFPSKEKDETVFVFFYLDRVAGTPEANVSWHAAVDRNLKYHLQFPLKHRNVSTCLLARPDSFNILLLCFFVTAASLCLLPRQIS